MAEPACQPGPAVAMTLRALPDELLAVVFGYCDDRTRMMDIPAVSKRWLGVCRHYVRNAAIDLSWAVRSGPSYSCAISVTDASSPGWCSGSPAPQPQTSLATR